MIWIPFIVLRTILIHHNVASVFIGPVYTVPDKFLSVQVLAQIGLAFA